MPRSQAHRVVRPRIPLTLVSRELHFDHDPKNRSLPFQDNRVIGSVLGGARLTQVRRYDAHRLILRKLYAQTFPEEVWRQSGLCLEERYDRFVELARHNDASDGRRERCVKRALAKPRPNDPPRRHSWHPFFSAFAREIWYKAIASFREFSHSEHAVPHGNSTQRRAGLPEGRVTISFRHVARSHSAAVLRAAQVFGHAGSPSERTRSAPRRAST